MTPATSASSVQTLRGLDRTTQMRLIPHIVRLGSDLRGPIELGTIRQDLAAAQAEGWDPKALYETAVQAKAEKGETKYPAPPYSEVDPTSA